MTAFDFMFCLAPGSVTPLRVNPERYYETIKVIEKCDLIYWICFYVQTVIEKCLGFVMRYLRPVFWFLGMNFFLVDMYVIGSIFIEQRIYGVLASQTKQLDQRVKNAFTNFHQHLILQSTLSNITVGALLDVLQLRLFRLPVLLKRGAKLMLETVWVVIAAATFTVLSVLMDPLSSIQEGYLDTYERNKNEMPERMDSMQVALPTVFDSRVDQETVERS